MATWRAGMERQILESAVERYLRDAVKKELELIKDYLRNRPS